MQASIVVLSVGIDMAMASYWHRQDTDSPQIVASWRRALKIRSITVGHQKAWMVALKLPSSTSCTKLAEPTPTPSRQLCDSSFPVELPSRQALLAMLRWLRVSAIVS